MCVWSSNTKTSDGVPFSAKAAGSYISTGLTLKNAGGRPPKLTDDDIEAAKAMLASPDIGVTQIAHRLGVSPATLYRYIPAARTANTPAFEKRRLYQPSG
jgi:DNA invertase Pin-like site-specific DNA recombinase